MITIPVQPVPAQSLRVLVAGLSLQLTFQTLRGFIYATVTCNGVPICAGRQLRDRVVFTARAAELGFPQLRLFVADLRGTSDPDWRDFGARYVLINADA